MLNKDCNSKTKDELLKEIDELQSKLYESEDALNAIKNGEVDAVVTHSQDGPKVYTLESADYLYRLLVQKMTEGVATLTYDGTIFYSNARLASMLQIPLEKLTNQRLNDFILPEDLDTYNTIFEDGLKTGSSGELSIISADGNIIPVYISINTFTELKGAYIVITDLSMQKYHEELKLTHEQLNKSLEELKRSNSELKSFAYVASHDLQEPLRMVISFSQLLEKRYKDRLDDEANEFIEFIVDGAQHMKFLIDDLLAYSKVTSKIEELEAVDLEKVLSGALSNLAVSIDKNKAIITHDKLPVVYASSQMGQVFQNLISNAIKFRGQNTPKINISVKKDKKEWIFDISDNGIGIDSKYQKQVFEVFKRLHTREEYPGTGIGLSIVKKIIIHQGGQIWIESELGKGSTFYFTIPIY